MNYDDLATLPKAEQDVHMNWASNHLAKRLKLWELPAADKAEILAKMAELQGLMAKHLKTKAACPRCHRAGTKLLAIKTKTGQTLAVHLDCLADGDVVNRTVVTAPATT